MVGAPAWIVHSQQPADQGESTATVWHLSAGLDAEGRTAAFTPPHEVFSAPGSFDKNRVQPLLDGARLPQPSRDPPLYLG